MADERNLQDEARAFLSTLPELDDWGQGDRTVVQDVAAGLVDGALHHVMERVAAVNAAQRKLSIEQTALSRSEDRLAAALDLVKRPPPPFMGQTGMQNDMSNMNGWISGRQSTAVAS